jgi:hypothetical protein
LTKNAVSAVALNTIGLHTAQMRLGLMAVSNRSTNELAAFYRLLKYPGMSIA